MSAERERQDLLKAYSGKKWLDKVKKMSDAQVVAIHKRLKAQKQI